MYDMAHIGIVVKDIDKSTAFYQQVLGGKVIEKNQNERLQLVLLSLGGQNLELLQYLDANEENRPAGNIDHIGFTVQDIGEEITRLKNLGVTCLSASPREAPGGKKILFFLGPDGERLEFIQDRGSSVN